LVKKPYWPGAPRGVSLKKKEIDCHERDGEKEGKAALAQWRR